MEYWISRDGQQFGPYSHEQVQQHLREGSISPNDLAWTHGNQNWLPVSQLIGETLSSTTVARVAAGALQRTDDPATKLIQNSKDMDTAFLPPGGIRGLFSFQGRVRRSTFWATEVGILVLWAMYGTTVSPTDTFPFLVSRLPLIPLAWIALATCAKRCHDARLSGWLAITLMIPLVQFVGAIVFGFLPGTDGQNQYGGDSSDKQSHGVRSGIGGILVGVGMLCILSGFDLIRRIGDTAFGLFLHQTGLMPSDAPEWVAYFVLGGILSVVGCFLLFSRSSVERTAAQGK
jgi:uncharacterized membrane protein YhaH (DUF805 family)